MAESFSRQKSRHAPQKEGGLKILTVPYGIFIFQLHYSPFSVWQVVVNSQKLIIPILISPFSPMKVNPAYFVCILTLISCVMALQLHCMCITMKANS